MYLKLCISAASSFSNLDFFYFLFGYLFWTSLFILVITVLNTEEFKIAFLVANDGFLLGYPFFVIDDNISSSINPVSVSLLIGLSPDLGIFL